MPAVLTTNRLVETFTSLADAMPQLIWMAERDGTVYYYNSRIAEFNGAELGPDGIWKWKGMLHPEDQIATEKAWVEAVTHSTVYEIEHRVMMQSGEYHWYLSRAFPQKDENGEVVQWFGTATDIHEQRKVQERLRISEAEFRAMFEMSTVGMGQADDRGRLLLVNDAFCQLTGYSRDELIRMSFMEITHPEDRDQDFVGYLKMVNGLKLIYHTEKRYLRKDGTVVWVIVTVSPVFDSSGQFKHTIAVIQDISDRKKIEQALERLATHFKFATNSARAGTWFMDLQSGKLEWSDLHKQLWGYDVSKQDLQYEDWNSRIYPDDLAPVLASLEIARRDHSLYEAEYRIVKANDGSTAWVRSVGQFIYNEKNEPKAVTGISFDITDKKNRENELIELKEQLELTVKTVPAGIILLNRKKEVVFANDRAAWFLRLNKGNDLDEKNVSSLHQLGKQAFKVFDRYDNLMSESRSPVVLAFETGKANEDVYRIEFNDGGEPKWIVYSCTPVLDNNGDTSMVLSTITDISQQKNAEQKIRQSEVQLRFLAESIPQLVWMADRLGNCEYKTGRWFEYSGLDPDDDDVLAKMLHPDDKEKIDELWAASLVTGKAFKDEARLRNRHGEYRWHALTGEPIVDVEGKLYKWIGVFTDIDEQKMSAERLELLVALRTRELQRSNEDLQQFAHVASHDLKEPLRKIRIYGSRLQAECKDVFDGRAREYLSKIEAATNRMASMIDGVLQYSSLNSMVKETHMVDLNGVMESIESDLEIVINQTGAVINYKKLPTIEGAPVLIYQLLYNLVNNSLKFRKESETPRIQIRSEITEIDEISYLKLEIEDNGIGFEQEYAEKIFNSFSRLNSKDKYEGTGLGLALCKKIVERHQGAIEARGEPEKGSVFTVVLPVKQSGRMI